MCKLFLHLSTKNKKTKKRRLLKAPFTTADLPSTHCTDLSVRLPEALVHLPYEFRSGRAHQLAHVEQVEYVVGGQHLGALACGRRARLELGEHSAGSGRRRRQTAAPPEV